MEATKRIKKQKQIIEKVRRWPRRLKRLLKTKDMKESEFCDKHGFQRSSFNRAKNLIKVPRESTVKAVEAALKKEGV